MNEDVFQTPLRADAHLKGKHSQADRAAERARRLISEGRFGEGKTLAEQALSAEPKHGPALETLGAALFHLGDPDAAMAQLDAALAAGYDSPSVRVNRGVLKSQSGDFDGAAAECERALQHDPYWTEAFHLLAQVRKFKPDDPVIPGLEAALARPMANKPRGTLCFAAGKIFADLGDDDRAFALYREGNRRLRTGFDRQHFQEVTQRLQSLCTRDFFAERRGSGIGSTAPIFVLGMPSSGSTLIERILTRHPQVGSVGEFAGMQVIANRHLGEVVGGTDGYPDALARMSGTQAASLARGYLEAAERRIGELPDRVVDKAPINYQNVALIALLFPNARIIHTARNPMDVGVSAYFRRFLVGQDWSYDLADIGFVLRREQALMRHWAQHAPLALLNVNYESLVQNPEGVARLLVAFAGLEWDEACLDAAADTGTRIYNASHYAARQPINTSSIGKWKRYDAHLETLKTALKQDLPPDR